MKTKTMICPELRRILAPPFAWIDRRYLFNGFLAELSHQENLLYFFLVLAADRDGLSFYSYDKICTLLKLDVDDYGRARNGLITKGLIAFDGCQFQVLALPARLLARHAQARAPRRTPARPRAEEARRDAEALATIFSRLAKGGTDEK